MKAKALYTITIDWQSYKKGCEYDIKKQVTIDSKDYFEILEKPKAEKPKKEKEVEKKEEA